MPSLLHHQSSHKSQARLTSTRVVGPPAWVYPGGVSDLKSPNRARSIPEMPSLNLTVDRLRGCVRNGTRVAEGWLWVEGGDESYREKVEPDVVTKLLRVWVRVQPSYSIMLEVIVGVLRCRHSWRLAYPLNNLQVAGLCTQLDTYVYKVWMIGEEWVKADAESCP